MNWIDMKSQEPQTECDIYFVADEDITDEKVGLAIPEHRLVILRRTDISFDDISHWIALPDAPNKESS